MGAVIIEIASNLVPGSQAKHATKLKIIDDLADAKFATTVPGGRVFANLVDFVQEAATAKMCFVAGILAMTAQGALPIEQVSKGMDVWARDEVTKVEGWKTVVETYVTHPTELFTLSIDDDEDGASDEEIVGTGEHPFWVEDLGTFLPMRDLQPGMRLSLAKAGGTAIVTGNVSKRGLQCERFTTYNFEVADFHTYFVGESGVWVHNTGKEPCEKIFSQFFSEAKALGGSWSNERNNAFALR